MSDHLSAWAGSGIGFRARTPEQKQRLVDAKAERRKIWRVRMRDDGTIERKQFASRDQVPTIEGWAESSEKAARIANKLLPTPAPVTLPAVILLPKPPRYNRDKPRCGATTRNGVPCQAQGNGTGGRCRNHGGMSTGARTPEGRARLHDAHQRRLARAGARHALSSDAKPIQRESSEIASRRLKNNQDQSRARETP
jgi:hypothetical protein